jgi:hypothetical protein
LILVDLYRNWDRHEAVRRFNAACMDPNLQLFEWKHLPIEAALLLPLERVLWPKVSDESSDEKEFNDDFTANKWDHHKAGEKQSLNEKRKRKGPVANTSWRTPNPFLPKPYPFYCDDIKKHPTWSELKEFLSYLYGVDEGDMAERVTTAANSKWNDIRNTIRKRIAHKREVQRILDPDTTVARNGVATTIARQIVNGGQVGKNNVPRLTDEQLLFVSNIPALIAVSLLIIPTERDLEPRHLAGDDDAA